MSDSDKPKLDKPHFENTSFKRKILVSGIIAVLCLSAVFACYSFLKAPSRLRAATWAGLDGSGTSDDPFLINNVTDLNVTFRNGLHGGNPTANTYFKLTASITNLPNPWTPLGTSAFPFKGILYSDNGLTIGTVTITSSAVTYAGLFGYTNGATISNIKVNASIVLVGPNGANGANGTSGSDAPKAGGDATISYYVGALVADATSTIIQNCITSGTVSVIGGIGGTGGRCTSTVNGSGNNYTGRPGGIGGNGIGIIYVGGLIGYSRNTTILDNTSTGVLTGKGSGGGTGGQGGKAISVGQQSTGGPGGRGGNGGPCYYGTIVGYMNSGILSGNSTAVTINRSGGPGGEGGLGGSGDKQNGSKGANGSVGTLYAAGHAGAGTYVTGTPVSFNLNTESYNSPAVVGVSATPSAQVYTPNQAYGTLPVPTSDNYGFIGWFTQSGTEGGIEITSDLIVDSSYTTLYARWAMVSAIVTFDANFSSNPSAVTLYPSSKAVVYGKSYGALPPPTLDGFKFGGWFTTAAYANALGSETGRMTNSTKVTNGGNHTLYARWIAIL